MLALARILGHKDASVTLRVYADLFDSNLRKDRGGFARELLSELCPAGVHEDL